MVDVSKLAGCGVLSKLQYADDLGLVSETIRGIRNKFRKWNEVFES